ncbi:hypothetical protein [Ammoniphilus sp. YIM 78166]|uniref:hypothetical protein n=1 Tax=Ammoniphilus sp. YIM 78166 TaxID=1644106 RepID=UPI00106F2FC1|nr:hypothetical protein [Ammoniphilus sp. YIM 78166]
MLTQLQSTSILLLALFYVVYFLFPSSVLFGLILLLLGISFIFGFGLINRTSRTLCVLMLIIGHVLFFISGGTWSLWVESLTKNMPLVTFLILIPLLSIPFRVEGHFQAVQVMAAGKLDGRQKFYATVATLTFMLCTLLNVGGMRLNYEMFDSYFKRYTRTGIQAMLRGYGATMLWAPYFPTVILILYYLDIPSYVYLGPALIFGLVSLGLIILYGWLVHRNMKENEELAVRPHTHDMDPTGKQKLMVLISLVLMIIFLSLVLERWAGFPIMMVIALISIAFPIVMWGFSRRKGAYRVAAGEYRVQTLPRMINEVSLFISAGFLGEMVARTEIGEMFPVLFSAVSTVSLWGMIFLLIVIIPLLAILGIHPLVTGSILGTSLSPAILGIEPVSLAGALIGGWAMALMLSPISAINIIVGGMVEKPPYVVGLKWNGVYGLCWAILLSTVLYGYHLF